MRAFVRPALLLLLALALAACSGGPDKAGGTPAHKVTVLRLALAVGDPPEVGYFINRVGQYSRGTLKIELTTGWRQGGVDAERQLIADVRAGRVDLGATGSRAWDLVGVTSLSALGAPMLIDSDALQRAVLRSTIVPAMLKGLAPLGLVGVAVLPGELRRPLGVAKPLLGPASYRGRRIGVGASHTASAIVRALGATPVPLAGGARITGLDGVEQPISLVDTDRYDTKGTYLTRNVVLSARPIVVFGNRTTLGRVTASQRRILERAASDAVTGGTSELDLREAEDTQKVCSRHRLRLVTASRSAVAALRQTVQPVIARLDRDPQSRGFIARIEAIRARLGAPVSTLPRCATARALRLPLEAPMPVDGTYAVAVRPGDLPARSRLPEQYGDWQIVLDRGLFRLSEQSGRVAHWDADGRVRVSGDTMTWTVVNALPSGVPDGMPVKNGDVLRFGWRRRGGTLLLAGMGAPTLAGLTARPLARVADAPGQQPLQNPAVLQGTWEGNATAADTIAHHDDVGGIPDNTGPLRLTFEGDRCRAVEHTPNGDAWSVGTCRFAGDTLEFDETPTADNPEPAPLFLHWSAFRGRLTLRTAPGFTPVPWTYEPWHKVG